MQERADNVRRRRESFQPCHERPGADVCVGDRVDGTARAWARPRIEGEQSNAAGNILEYPAASNSFAWAAVQSVGTFRETD